MTIEVPEPLAERLVCLLERLLSAKEPAEDPEALLTKEQVARKIGKSPREVQRLCAEGKIRKVPNLGKKTLRVRPVDLRKFLESAEEKAVGRRRL